MSVIEVLRRTSTGPKPSQASHDAILEAAEQLLKENGSAAGFTMEAVAKRAQAGKPTVYRHWKTKEALFLALAKLRILSINNRVPDLGSVAAELARFHDELWGRLSRQPFKAIGRSLLAAAMSDDGVQSEVHEQFASARRRALREILARGIERCELSRDLDIELAIDIISGFSTYRFLLGLPVDAVMIRQMVGMLLKGLRLPVNGRVDGRTSTRELSP